MGKDWDYAKLSEKAAEMGGADNLLEIVNNLDLIKKAEFERGITKGSSDTVGKMAPLFAVVGGLCVGATLLVQEIRKKIAKKKEERRISAELAAEAEAQLIDILTDSNGVDPNKSEPDLEEKQE